MNKILLIFILGIQSLFSLAQDVEYLDLAKILIKDKNYSRAQIAINNAIKSGDADPEQLSFIQGLINLRLGKFNESLSYFSQVTDNEYASEINVYRAEVFFKMGQFKKSLEYLRLASEKFQKKDSVQILKFKILAKLNKDAEAVGILNNLIKTNKKAHIVLIHYLVDKKLYEEAHLQINSFLNKYEDIKYYDYYAKLLLKNNQIDKAIYILEYANLKHTSVDQLKLLASIYDLKKFKYTVGDLYIRLAYIDNNSSFHTAEYLRQNKRSELAKIINLSVKSPKKQLRQKLSLLIEEERFDLVKALEKTMDKYGALENDENKYAMAYGHFMLGDYDRSLKYLKNIRNSKIMRKSTKLIELATECHEKVWECNGNI